MVPPLMPPPAMKALKTAGPVVASAAVVDARGAAELAEDHHERLAEQAVGLEVADERGEGGIHGGAVVPHRVEDAAVVVEAAAVDLHEAHARLDEAAGEQGAAAELGVAVALDGLRASRPPARRP